MSDYASTSINLRHLFTGGGNITISLDMPNSRELRRAAARRKKKKAKKGIK